MLHKLMLNVNFQKFTKKSAYTGFNGQFDSPMNSPMKAPGKMSLQLDNPWYVWFSKIANTFW